MSLVPVTSDSTALSAPAPRTLSATPNEADTLNLKQLREKFKVNKLNKINNKLIYIKLRNIIIFVFILMSFFLFINNYE